MSSRPAPRPRQSPVQWVSGVNVLYRRLLSVPAQECHGVTYTLFNRQSRDVRLEMVYVAYSTVLFQLHTLYGVEWNEGKGLEYRDGHDILKNRSCDIHIFLY